MKTLSLNGKWHVESVGCYDEAISMEGNVPGSVLAYIIENYEEYNNVFWRDNAEKVQKFENYNWHYSKEFEVETLYPNPHLYFGRLDTYCDIYLNGKHVAYCDNGNISHTLPVDGILAKGTNKIDIYFYSPITKVSGMKPCTGAFTTERINTRRMQCSYGWDWTMRFVSCGIYRDAYVLFKDDSVIIEDVYVYTKNIDSDSAQVGVDVRFEANAGDVLSFDIYDAENNSVKHFEKYCKEDFLRLSFDIADPDLWYPVGYGKQPLYRLEISCMDGLLKTVTFGIRTVKVLQVADKVDSDNYKKCFEMKKSPFGLQYDCDDNFACCTLKINGIKIMCKGGNWVPSSPFYMGNLDEKITETLERAVECGINMIRVWGGGQFETEHFYDECSRLGITVCQDFLMACGRYPEDKAEFIEQLQKEALYAARLLKNKACLVWWHGDNENAVWGCDTDTDYSGRRSAYLGIAPILYKEDPYREFMPSSPFGGNKYASNTAGTTHTTQYLEHFFRWLENEDLSDYKEYLYSLNARFIMEDPTMGAICNPSLLKMMTEDDIYGDDMSMWKYHTQSNPALKYHLFDYIDMFTSKVLGKYANGKDRYFKYKYIQYEWLRLSMERARREKWFCSGNMFWMVNECWPAAAGWSILDWYNMPKASFYAFKRTAQPVTVSVIENSGVYSVYVSNDTLKYAPVSFSIKSLASDGKVTELMNDEYTVSVNSTDLVCMLSASAFPENTLAVIVDVYDENRIPTDRSFVKNGALNLFPCDDGDYAVEFISDDTLKVTAHKYIHAFEAEGNAILSDNYFSLLPGESKLVTYRKTEENAEFTFTAYTILG